MSLSREQKKIASIIDQTLLRADATEEEVEAFCRTADEYGFASVCIHMRHLKVARLALQKSKVRVCTVVDFPLGAGGLAVKSYEATAAIAAGADEVDIVIDQCLVKMHRWRNLRTQLSHVTRSVRRAQAHRVDAAERPPVIEKIILETSTLTDEEIAECCKCCMQAGADFVKTSTGFAKGGATVHAVQVMKQAVGDSLGIKASGGIKTASQLQELVAAGATRIGTSCGTAIVDSLA